MDKTKRKGGAEKLRAKKRQALQADAAKCAKLTDMFTAGPAANISALMHYLLQHLWWPMMVVVVTGTVRRMRRGREMTARVEGE